MLSHFNHAKLLKQPLSKALGQQTKANLLIATYTTSQSMKPTIKKHSLRSALHQLPRSQKKLFPHYFS